ncbi:pro-sigmaK processing inhibitor BofA family protein [Candidatus Soleaferrea massiliensis]|uniref:pro-sigmaK processing inhibitor BofA family protein n=1 Tax=Candidatus Soleaferrea massiliensis TaxID=1470354 RepID=UPI00059093EF|nr:pro-sigmaK processing inhibitor BofA family protein [Candidatus Soleaferrea massiliensis]
MGIADIAIFCVMAAIFILMVKIYIKTRRPFAAAMGNMSLGLLGLLGINLTTSFTSIGMVYNIFTVFTSLMLGLPGVISMLIVKLMWGVA